MLLFNPNNLPNATWPHPYSQSSQIHEHKRFSVLGSEMSQWTDALSAGIMALIAVSSVFNTVDDVTVAQFELCCFPIKLQIVDFWL